MKKIGVLLVSTNKYSIFVQPLVNDIDKNFFVDHKIEIYLFTDKEHTLQHSDRITVVQIPTEHKPFPHSTLKRYEFFSKAADKITSDYLFYMDVDMSIVNPVGEEILPAESNEGLTATRHPGFYNGGWGSQNCNPKSKAYIPKELWKTYYAGGFQGGKTQDYLKVCKLLSDNIADDESRGVMAEWHDETHWNAYLSTRTPKTLTPEYCMVEQQHLREKWGISHFQPKIVALAKNHEELRN